MRRVLHPLTAATRLAAKALAARRLAARRLAARRLAARTLAAATLVAVAVVTFAVAGPAAAATPKHHTLLVFSLVTPNTAVAPSGGAMAAPGDWISVTGGGVVDVTAGTVRASGAFVHHSADGTVHCSGTWAATALTGVSGAGTPHATVSLLVSHYCTTMGDTHPDIPMTVTSGRAGVTVGEFTVPTGGRVVIEPRR